jgi:hypothetical protein
MSAFSWNNELLEAQVAERAQALEHISHLVKTHRFTEEEIIPLVTGSSLKPIASPDKVPSKLYDPFFDA